MATGVVISVAEKLFTVITSQEFKDICSVFGYESELKELASTVSIIKGVLLDADLKHQELTHNGREYIEGLKDAVYDVDDVLDEFNTIVQKENNKQGGKTSKKVRRFFSRSNQVLFAFKMSSEIKNIRAKLDSIAKNREQFGFSDVYAPITQRKESGSYARADSIFGRDADKEDIVGVLVPKSHPSPIIGDNVSFLTIVGMGGLGKTALAQLVYNDKKVIEAFELRLWVCVSNEFSMEQILAKIQQQQQQQSLIPKILAKMIEKNVGLGMEELQREVRMMIEGRRYLLVLDDVWDENHNKWVELRDFLVLGGDGSRVLTTTRSKAVAKAIGNIYTHELRGLSDEHSWRLFQNMAFEQGIAPLDSDLVDIGKEVVKKCANIPLAIRVIGSLLYGQHIDKWLSFKSIDFRNLGSREDGQAEDGIMPILKYSYYHLSPSLKSCFSFCALFPKDFKIRRTIVIWLWMAHGCLDLSNDGRSMEAVGEDYFSILFQRCFFHIEENVNDKFYKMHDLIHDLALEVAGKESLALETAPFQVDKNIRHLSIGNDGCKLLSTFESCLSEMKKLRSLRHNFDQSFYPTADVTNVNKICSNITRLRVLDLACWKLRKLPRTISNLSHLRYLDLSYNDRLEVLPESITKLHNLLILNLSQTSVRELPKGLRKLHNLRHLDLFGCKNLTHMPVGMDNMTNLQTLSMFVVADNTSKHVKTGELKDLGSLIHLGGRLEIIFKSGLSYDLVNTLEEECLLSKKVNLTDLVLLLEDDPVHECDKGHEILLEGLRPHCNIKSIEISGYKGNKIPGWVGSLAMFFTCLIQVSLHGFHWLYNLPAVSQLLHLKVLKVSCMPNVEFIENNAAPAISTTSARLPFFPSLEELNLRSLPKLKGVWGDDFLRTEAHRNLAALQSFPYLHKLRIEDCPCLTEVPRCPSLRDFWVLGVNEAFRFSSNLVLLDESANSIADSSIYLDLLLIDKVELVKLLFSESLKGIDDLFISGFQQEMLSSAADLFQKYASSLRNLCLSPCYGIKSLCGGGIEHLKNLRYLNIGKSDDLDLGVGDEPWKSLKNLNQLDLSDLSKLIYLPEGFQHLTSLRFLRINDCNLESLPEWLPSLPLLRLWLQSCQELKSLPEAILYMPSLRDLRVWYCKGLTDRCREPHGQDWPKLSHINIVDIR